MGTIKRWAGIAVLLIIGYIALQAFNANAADLGNMLGTTLSSIQTFFTSAKNSSPLG